MDGWTTLWARWVVEEALPARLRQAVSLSTLRGEPFHRHSSFFRIYLKSNLRLQ